MYPKLEHILKYKEFLYNLVFYNSAYSIIYKVVSFIHLTNPFCSKRLALIQFSNSLSVIFFLFSMRETAS